MNKREKFDKKKYDKKYRDKYKHQFNVDLNIEEYEELSKLLELKKISKVDFVRNAFQELKKK